MKELFKNTSKFLLALGAGSVMLSLAYAEGPVGVVGKVEGHAFVRYDGKTKQLREGDFINDFAEVYTEVGSQLTISDYYDHRYHLSGSGFIKFQNRLVELRRGYLWIQSLQPQQGFIIQTGNALISFDKGEGIASFDPSTGKSQLLVMKGKFSFSNLLQKDIYTVVNDGQFSFVHDEYNNGIPRRPTPIGFSSYKRVTSLFPGIVPLGKSTDRMRTGTLKTAQSPKAPNVRKKPLIYDKSIKNSPETQVGSALFGRIPASKTHGGNSHDDSRSPGSITLLKLDDPEVRAKRKESLLNFQHSKLKKMRKVLKEKAKFKPNYRSPSGVPIYIFGMDSSSIKKKRFKAVPKKKVIRQQKKKRVSRRNPASVGGMGPKIKSKNAFESQLLKEYKNQMRHSNEMNSLIKELNSINQDFDSEY